MTDRLGRWWDYGLYPLSAAFAAITAATSTLASHRAWGAIAVWGYVAASLAVGLLLLNRSGYGVKSRFALTSLCWLTVTWLPIVLLARRGLAQEEVTVVEESAVRLLERGTPYLTRPEIAALPDPLLGYNPYQPGMALFGLPHAISGEMAWWTDARIWFALATAAALLGATLLLSRAGNALNRALQAATVLPLCALTLATGGDDLPVLALCLLALALAARSRFGWAGLAIGAAAAMKLFAWPVLVVLGVYMLTKRATVRYAAGALGLPALALLPSLLIDYGAVVENVLRYPSGHGLITSPAASPLVGQLLTAHLPGGRLIALGLLTTVALAIGGYLVKRPPADVRIVALICAAGLLAAILLLPATRFGYLLYPVAFALWAPVLGEARPGAGEGVKSQVT